MCEYTWHYSACKGALSDLLDRFFGEHRWYFMVHCLLQIRSGHIKCTVNDTNVFYYCLVSVDTDMLFFVVLAHCCQSSNSRLNQMYRLAIVFQTSPPLEFFKTLKKFYTFGERKGLVSYAANDYFCMHSQISVHIYLCQFVSFSRTCFK